MKPLFQPGDQVYGIAHWYSDGKPTNYVAIYPAVVEQLTLYKDGHEYWLQTPDGKSWGMDSKSDHVFSTFEEACNYMKDYWYTNSNTF